MMTGMVQVKTFAEDWPETGEGLIQMRYAPKQCLVAPCPTWKVLKFKVEMKDGAKSYDVEKGAVDAYISNMDSDRSSMTSFYNVFVKGKWKKTSMGVEIIANEWFSIVSEKVSPGPGKGDLDKGVDSGKGSFFNSNDLR